MLKVRLTRRLTHRWLHIAVLAAIVLVFALTSPAFAFLYKAAFTVASNLTDYTGLPVSCLTDVDFMVGNGFITTATALDTRIETFGGVEQIHMMASDRIMAFVPSLPGKSQLNWYLTTGNTPLSIFPVIVGKGGNVTAVDHDDLELGNNFSVEFEGWMDTSTSNVDASFPSIVTSSTSEVEAVTQAHNITLPSGIVAGNLLLVIFQSQGAAHSITWPPTGWTSLAQYGAAASRCLGVAYKVATSSEGVNITVASNVAVCSAHNTYRITDHSGVPEFAGTVGETLSANPNPPILAPTWGATYPTLWIAGFGGGGNNARTVSSYPASYESGIFIEAAYAGPLYIEAGSAQRPLLAVSEDPGTYTLSGTTNWRAYTIGVRGNMPPPGECFVAKNPAFCVYPDSGTIHAAIVTTTNVTQIAASASSGEHTVRVWADTSDFGIDIGGVTQNTTALAGAFVHGNANNWTICNLPYMDDYSHTVNGTARILYEPDTLIVGTVLPNQLNPGTYDGVIAWGTNPYGVTVTLGSLTAEATSVTVDDDEGYDETLHDVDVTDWFKEPDIGPGIGAKLENHPLRPLVRIMVVSTSKDPVTGILNAPTTELQAWRFLGLAILLLVTVASAVGIHGHLLIAGLACGGTIAVLVQQTIWPGWTLVFIIPAIIAGILAERTPSIG